MRYPWKATFLALCAVSLAACFAGCDGKGPGGIIPPADAQEETDVLSWTAPTQRVDGSALAPQEIAVFRIYSSSFPAPIEVGGSATSHAVPRPLDGRRCYAMTTVDTNAQESDRSGEVCSEKCPTGFRINEAGAGELPGAPRPPDNLGVE